MAKLNKKVEALILSNLGFVDGLALKRKNRYRPAELEDLIQAGRVGLVEAAKRFDRSKANKNKTRFTTYAYHWINKYMVQEYIRARYKLHIPDKKLRKVRTGNKIKSYLEENELFREPTYKELLKEMTNGLEGSSREIEEVTKTIALGENFYSLNKNLNEASEVTFADLMVEEGRTEDTLDDILPEQMSEVLNTLTEYEKRILEVRFGIGTGKVSSLEEVADEFGMSKESIRHSEEKAIRKLRHPSRSRKLKDFM